MTDLLEFLAEQVADSEVAWSLGTFGALAEFTREPDEPVALDRDDGAVSVVTGRGALRIARHPELRPIASESPTAESWSHRVALCLPEGSCAMSGRTEFSEVGLDREAPREEDRAGVLFDLGLGALQADFHVRSGDPEIIAALRACTGKSVFSPGSGAMKVILAANPHRVFVSRLGRVEVYQPIPPAGGKSPSGPHTHVLPKLLAHGRTHSANEPLPTGWVPCAHFYPPHPQRDAFGSRRPFQPQRDREFQMLMARYGDPRLLDIKRSVTEAVAADRGPPDAPMTADRFGRAAVRIALRQVQAAGVRSPALTSWLSVHDRFEPDEPNDSSGEHPCTA
jgi:hypothetical protein